MNEDEEEYLRRSFSVESDKTLDNLAELHSASQSTIFSPTFHGTMYKPGDAPPPHRHPHHPHHHHPSGDNELVEVTGPSNFQPVDGTSGAGETTPVRRLKVKSDSTVGVEDALRPGPVERQLTDTYLETQSRTPRYNTYADYNEMVDNLMEGDPFRGEYTSSGKGRKVDHKHKKKKTKHQKESGLPTDDIDGPLPKTSDGIFSKKKKKSKRLSGSRDSTGTFTVEGHSNPSFERSIDRQEAESVQSNGTYTLKREDSLASLKTHPAVTRNTTTDSFTIKRISSKRKTKIGIDRRGLTQFVKVNQLKQRIPKDEAPKHSGGAPPKYLEKGKHIWHYHTHTSTQPCDSYGEIEFHGYAHDTESSPYIRVANDTKPELVLDIMLNYWKLPTPKLLISVTGGAKRFEMKPKLLERFKRGLIGAATSTGAWIITGGTGTGVMEIVGQGVHDHIITYGKQKDIVCLGVPLWGVIANRDALDESVDGNYPAIYSKEGLESEVGKKRIPLDQNHTHFVIVDDGSRDKYGGEIEFRANLEKTISHMLCGSEDMSSNIQVNTPVISVIIEGGLGSMKTVAESIKNGIPVLVLDGSGRAADFIAYGYSITKDLNDDDKTIFRPDYREIMESMATNDFEWKRDESDKPAKIATCLKQLESALKQRRMITVFNLNSDSQEFDKAILNALLKANKSNQAAQLSLALAWNRSDIAKNEIFSAARNTIIGSTLHDAMTTALIQNKKEFVKLFLDNGVELKGFLNIKNLWNLYANCLNDKTDRSAQLLNNLMMYLKQTWGAYLCCRPVENLGNQPDLVKLVGKTIVHLMGDEAMNPYCDDKFAINGLAANVGYIEDDTRADMSMAGKNWRKIKYEIASPERELFIWALLLNRMELAKLFWRIGKDQLASALFAASLLKGLSNIADDDEEVELSLSLLENSEMFEKLAVDVMSQCYQQNKILAHQLLVQQVHNYGNTTLLLLADANELMDFMDHTCCQTKLNSVWKGRMALYTSTYKILASMVLPFLIPAIKFTSNKMPSEYLEDDEEQDYDDLAEAVELEGGYLPNPKVAPAPLGDSKRKNLKKKLYQVSLIGSDQQGISVWSALYHFYTAPVTKFWWYTIAYLFFLAIFTFFVLTDLHPVSTPNAPSIMEVITWCWTVTMVIEEVRQVMTRDQRSLLYKLRSWWANVWNRFDLMMYNLFALSVMLRYLLGESDFTWARMTYSITLTMYYLRFMQTFFVEKNIGPKVIMIRKMLTDLLFFFAILAVFVLSFGTAYQANLFPNAPASWSLLKQVVYLPYWQIYGELFIENIEGEVPSPCTHNETLWRSGLAERCAANNALVPVLLAIYMMLTNILLVNLLIAMFSDTFQKVQDNSLKVWRFYKFSLVYEYYERPSIFPPFIIINHAFRGVRWIIHKFCREMNYHDDFKLLLKEKDNIRLSLFEREAVQDYLHTSRELKREQLDSKVATTATRLEKVIDELDNIKESVQQQNAHMTRKPFDSSLMDATPRDINPSTARSLKSATPKERRLQDQVNELSSYIHGELASINKTMQDITALLIESRKPHVGSPRALDITHMATSEDL